MFDVNSVEKIAYERVVSKMYSIHYSEMEQIYKDFMETIVSKDAELVGPYFYSLLNVPKEDGVLEIEMFVGISEDQFECEGYRFHTYYEVGPLMHVRVSGNIESSVEIAYVELLETLELNDLDLNTPFYHIPASDGSPYLDIYLGFVYEETNFLKITQRVLDYYNLQNREDRGYLK